MTVLFHRAIRAIRACRQRTSGRRHAAGAAPARRRFRLSAALLLACTAPATAGAAPATHAGDAATGAAALNTAIGSGLNSISRNIGLDQPLNAAYKQRLAQHFAALHAAGFRSIRFALPAFQYMDAQDRLDPRWVAWLDARVQAALDARLVVIIDEHDSPLCSKDALLCQRQLKAYWQQIAPHFAGASPRLIFEILNEPHGAVTTALWNRMIADVIPIIRKTNPQRTLMVGPGSWYSLRALPQLTLPETDRNIIVSIHYYEPFEFTHQNAFWIAQTRDIVNRAWGTPQERSRIEADFDAAAQWAKAKGRPMNLGEYGAYMKAPLDSRIAWLKAVTHAADSRGLSRNYWIFGFDQELTDRDALQKEWGGDAVVAALARR